MAQDPQTIDYDAIAKQHGALTGGPGGTIDYDALAQEHGAVKSVQTAPGSPWQAMDPQALEEQIKGNPFRVLQIPFEQLGGTASRAHDQLADQMLSDAANGRKVSKGDYVKHFLLGAGADAAKMTAGTLSPEGIGTGVATAIAPEVMGPVMLAHGAVKAAENVPGAASGNPEAVQNLLLSGAEAAGGGAVTGGAFGAGAATPARAAAPEIRSGWRKVGNPMGLASTGEELLKQGISPRTSMSGFDTSLQRAAADLKAFDAQSPIQNVHDLNDAIPEIKKQIWDNEIEPALKRQATKPVTMKPVADAVRKQISDEMREFDEPNADKLEAFAKKLETARDVTKANGLLKYANGQLESYFQKFPAARKANLMSNPETAGWEAARAELRNQFLTTLENAGETGVRDARLRYGAFDTLQDAVERRVNVADRAKPMSLGRIVGLAGAAPSGGLSLLAGELSNYLNKPDVLIRQGISRIPANIPVNRAPAFSPGLVSMRALAGASGASRLAEEGR